MRLLFRLALAAVINGLALLAADRFVNGFTIATSDLKSLIILTLILTALNYGLKPILKLLLGPLIVLSLGLGTILVNAFILKLLDFLSPALSIQGLLPLLAATVIVSIINFAFHLVTRTSS